MTADVYSIASGRSLYAGWPAPEVDPLPVLRSYMFNKGSTLRFKSYHETSRYERFQQYNTVKVANSAATATEMFGVVAFDPGGGDNVRMQGTTYHMYVDATEEQLAAGTVTPIATTTVVPNTVFWATFTYPAGTLSHGFHKIDLRGNGPEGLETGVSSFVCILHPGQSVAFTHMPAFLGTWETHYLTTPYVYTWLPCRFNPKAVPLLPRATPAFSTQVLRQNLFLEYVVLTRTGNVYRPNYTRDGVMVAQNVQPYHWERLVMADPKQPLLDGPRGIGTCSFVTHISVDRHGGAYCTDPWRVFRVDKTGHVTTRWGWRHVAVASNYLDTRENQYTLELVGNWDAIPPERRGLHEVWGMCFDPRTVANPASLDLDAPQQPSPLEGGALEHPHKNPVRQFVADTQNNRVLLATFPRDDFNGVPVITEFITGLNDPWDIVPHGNRLYVSVRKDHKINAYDMDTGAFIETVVQFDPALETSWSQISFTREHLLYNTLSERRRHPCLSPEGLYMLGDWLYYGAAALSNIRRVNVITKVVEDVSTFAYDDNTNFAKIAVSDGTAGPVGTTFVSTWSNNIGFFGYPQARMPGDIHWPLHTDNPDCPPRGRGPNFMAAGYGSAVGVGNGRIYFGTSNEGLGCFSVAQSGDVAITSPQIALYKQGTTEWNQSGLELIHGRYGYGFQNFPLPWGRSAAIDFYLTANGHTPP